MERSVCRYYFFDFFATFFAAFLTVFFAAFFATFLTAFFTVFFTAFFGAAFFAVFFATFLTAFFVAIYVMRVLVNKIRPQHLLELKEQFGERRYLLTYIIARKKNLHNHFYKIYLWIRKCVKNFFKKIFHAF